MSIERPNPDIEKMIAEEIKDATPEGTEALEVKDERSEEELERAEAAMFAKVQREKIDAAEREKKIEDIQKMIEEMIDEDDAGNASKVA